LNLNLGFYGLDPFKRASGLREEVISVKQKPALVLADELVKITSGVGKELLSIIIPPLKTDKPMWCQCAKCGRWHRLGD
jgi:hypothetical protein